jgi:hypothetical protein
MRRYNATLNAIRPEAQISLPYPVSNPTAAQFRAEGWIPVVELPTLDDGMIGIGPVVRTIADGVCTLAYSRVLSQSDYDAERAAQAAQDQAEQAVKDAQDYRNALLAVAGLAQLVPTIAPGDDIETVGAKALAAHNAALADGDQARASQINAMSTAALMAYNGKLVQSGCVGDRMWRAFAVLTKGSQ